MRSLVPVLQITPVPVPEGVPYQARPALSCVGLKPVWVSFPGPGPGNTRPGSDPV